MHVCLLVLHVSSTSLLKCTVSHFSDVTCTGRAAAEGFSPTSQRAHWTGLDQSNEGKRGVY